MAEDPFVRRAVSLLDRETIMRAAGDAEFLGLAAAAARGQAGAVLLSGGRHECSRFSIAAWDPFMTLRARRTRVRISTSERELSFSGDPLSCLDEIAGSLRPTFPSEPLPFAGGAVGYFAFDLKNSIERLPRRARADASLPEIFLFWPRRLLIHDRTTGEIARLTLGFERDAGPPADSLSGERAGRAARVSFTSNFTRRSYIDAVQKIRRYIRRGDVYQVSLAQRFRAPFDGDPYRLWMSLFERNPAPFFAFVQAGDHQVVSTSMERFLHREEGVLESRPIKGTRPRGSTTEEDERLKAELMGSRKEDAELSMIVDLIRNDLGRVCELGSVEVREHRRLETYANVHHLVSVVRGVPRPDVTPASILRATFPGGSVTGCPKIRALQIIDELEPHARHVYTGAIGYLGMHGTMDLSVAIRTALIHGGVCSLWVGGGIVYDSVPEEEYMETLHKGRTFFEVMGTGGAGG